jgi:para-nitrobenzyl esterase
MAGGGSVFMLMTSPLAKGLFAKAIVESGGGRGAGFGGPPRRLREAGPNGQLSGEAVGVEFATKNGIAGDDAAALAALRKLPAATIVGGLNLMSMMQQPGAYAGQMIDGQVVVEPAEQAFRAGRQARVPLVIGANDVEMPFPVPPDRLDAMLAPLGTERDAAIAAYGGKEAMGRQIFSDMMMIEPARMMARLHAAAGNPTWQYRFSYVPTSLRGKVPGALHATEIPFVFATVKAKYEAATTPRMSRWARRHTPTGRPSPRAARRRPRASSAWPACTATSETLMDFAVAARSRSQIRGRRGSTSWRRRQGPAGSK